MKMKKGKYVGHDFTPAQLTARRQHMAAHKRYCELCDALRFAPDTHTDEEMHARLQYNLDHIRSLRVQALHDFSEVSESFTIASGVVY